MKKENKQEELKDSVAKELANMLKSEKEPSEGRMKLLKTCIGFLAVQAKLEESEYGGFFGEGDTPSIPERSRPEPDARSYAPDTGSGSGEFFPEGPTSSLPS